MWEYLSGERHRDRTPESSLRCLILGGEKIPTNFEFICALFRWLGAFFEKKIWSKRSNFSRTSPKSKFFIRTVKWALRAHFWVFFSKNLPMASCEVCAHLPFRCNTISCQSNPPACFLWSKWLKIAQIRHLSEFSGVLP